MFITINPSLQLKASVVFEDPKWVAVIERTETQGGVSTARVEFDSEPSEGDVQAYVTQNYETLEFSKPVNKAQEAMKRLLEQRKQGGTAAMRGQHNQAARLKTSTPQMKNKDRHRGVR